MYIQQQTTSEVSDTEKVMAYNKDIYTPLTQDISNVFAVTYLLSHSSFDPAKYKREWLKAKLTHSSILSSGKVQTHAVENCPLH